MITTMVVLAVLWLSLRALKRKIQRDLKKMEEEYESAQREARERSDWFRNMRKSGDG